MAAASVKPKAPKPATAPKAPPPLAIEYVAPGTLKPAPYNPRTMTDEARARLERGLREFGMVDPIVARRADRLVIGGHQRLAAAHAIGLDRVPVVYLDGIDDDRAAALNVLLNNPNAQGAWDMGRLSGLLSELDAGGFDATLTGFDASDLEGILTWTPEPERAGEEREDVDLTPPAKPKSARGAVYELGRHRLMCGDSTNAAQIDRLLGGVTMDAIFTSPPYAVGLAYDEYEDTLQNLRLLLAALATTWGERVKAGGYCVTNFGDVVSARDHVAESEPCEYPMAVEYWPIFRAAGWVLHTRRVWAKPHARVAAPWTASSNRAASDWEHLWTWKRHGRGLNERREPSYLGVWDTSRGSNVDVGKETHPGAFPTILPRWALEVYSNAGERIADPFGGTGTTLIAAEQTGRTAYLMELSPAYCDVIRRRYAELVGRPDLAP